jgi:peptide/nickel transport system substrate-binding protein
MPDLSSIRRRDFLRYGLVSSAGLAGAPALLQLLAACANSSTPPSTNTLTIGIAGDTQTLDPDWGQDNRINETLKNIYAQWDRYALIDSGQGFQTADTNTIVGEAISYTVDPDNVTVHFTVRDAKFPSGNPMTSDDFIYTIKRAFGVNAGTAFDFHIIGISDLSQITKVDDHHFTIKLTHPTALLGPSLRDQDAGVVDSKIVQAHATSDDPWAQKWLAKNAAPSGAYTVSSWVPGTKVVLTANPNYWGAKPYFSTVVLQEIPAEDERVLLLKNGSIDIAADLTVNAILSLKQQNAAGVKFVSAHGAGQDRINFVVNKPPFNNVLLRQALAYAIDINTLVSNTYLDLGTVPKGVWPVGSAWFTSAPWPYKYDVQQAKALLAQAGHPNGFAFTMEISNSDGQAQKVAVPIQTNLQAVGIQMTISKLDPAVLQQHLGQGTGQAFIQTFGGGANYIDDPYFLMYLSYASYAVINWAKYKNPALDAVSNQLATAVDVAQRKQLAGQAHAILNQDLPIYPIADTVWVLPMRSNIKGYVYEPDSLTVYKYLSRG